MKALLAVGFLVMGGTSAVANAADKQDAEKLKKQLYAEMEKKALVPEDLPDEGAALLKRADSALKRRDWPQAVEHYTTLRESVAQVVVERPFLEAKAQRLHEAAQGVTLTDAMKKALDQFSSALSEGRFLAASQALNQLQKRLANAPHSEVSASLR